MTLGLKVSRPSDMPVLWRSFYAAFRGAHNGIQVLHLDGCESTLTNGIDRRVQIAGRAPDYSLLRVVFFLAPAFMVACRLLLLLSDHP